ncbi:MAG: hypothetical protein V1834_04380, partial [Candidatus Micrarchaeota archaeon]
KWFEDVVAPDFLLRQVDDYFNTGVISRPGFCCEKFSSVLLRNIYLNEKALIGVEKAFSKAGKRDFLYGGAKEAGWRYGEWLELPSAAFVLRDALMQGMNRYFAVAYGMKSSVLVSWRNRRCAIKLENTPIMRKLGKSAFMQGSWVGYWAFFCRDKTIECFNKLGACGPFGFKSEIVSAPAKNLPKIDFKYPNVKPVPFTKRYNQANTPVDSNIEPLFELPLADGLATTLEFQNDLFFQIEASFLFIPESKAPKLFYKPVFKAFEELGKKVKKKGGTGNKLEYACRFFTTLGWGLVEATGRREVTVRGFPWTPEVEQIGVSKYFLGSFDGFLTGLTGKKVKSKVNVLDKEKRFDFKLSF